VFSVQENLTQFVKVRPKKKPLMAYLSGIYCFKILSTPMEGIKPEKYKQIQKIKVEVSS